MNAALQAAEKIADLRPSALRSCNLFSAEPPIFPAVLLFVPYDSCAPSADTTALPYTAGISFTSRRRLPAVITKRNNQSTFFTPRTFTCRRMLLSSLAPAKHFLDQFPFSLTDRVTRIGPLRLGQPVRPVRIGFVLGYVRHHVSPSQPGDEFLFLIQLVRS